MTAGSRGATDPLELLERCDPARRSALASGEIADAFDEIGAAIVAEERRPRRGSQRVGTPRRNLVVLAAAIAALAGGVATAAVVLGAHTGLFPTKAEQAMGGPGEALNPAASDFRKVALQVAADIPYPPGYGSWREWVLAEQVPTADSGPGGSQFPAGLVSSGALRGWFAGSAFCAWVQNWRQATVANDSTAAAQAAREIQQAPDWKAVRDEDPNPNPAAANDPGAVSGTLFGWMLPYRDAVVAGDPARVEQLLASGYGGGRCWLSDPEWMAQVRAHSIDWRTLSQAQTAKKYEQFLATKRS